MRRCRNRAAGYLMALCLVAVVGCRYDNAAQSAQSGDSPLYDVSIEFDKRLDGYLREVRDLARDTDVAAADMIGTSFTTREYESKYEVVYVDYGRTVFSYRVVSYFYTGGAHGNRIVGVGTMDVASGRELTLDDVIPADRRTEALARVRRAVVEKLGGEDKLLSEVELTENFYIAGDGLHFVFNEYEVAAYCFGVIEVVIPAYPNPLQR